MVYFPNKRKCTRSVVFLKQIKKCLPHVLKSTIFCPSSCLMFSFELPETAIIFLPLKACNSSLSITNEGPSGMCGFCLNIQNLSQRHNANRIKESDKKINPQGRGFIF